MGHRDLVDGELLGVVDDDVAPSKSVPKQKLEQASRHGLIVELAVLLAQADTAGVEEQVTDTQADRPSST